MVLSHIGARLIYGAVIWDNMGARMTQEATITPDDMNATTTCVAWREVCFLFVCSSEGLKTRQTIRLFVPIYHRFPSHYSLCARLKCVKSFTPPPPE
jgi:hypothetical protein